MVRPTTTTAHFIRFWWCTNIRPPTITYMGLLSSADPFVHHSTCWTVAHFDEAAWSSWPDGTGGSICATVCRVQRPRHEKCTTPPPSTPATTPTTRPHATTRPPPTPPRVGTAHICLGPAWTTRVRSMAAFTATQTERSTRQERTAPRRHPAQPVAMRAKSGGSTPTRGSDLAYGAPRPPQASAGASGGGGGALVRVPATSAWYRV